ncbi:MAG: hypothetical protein AAFX94_05490 [Myxococcota bacterium]
MSELADLLDIAPLEFLSTPDRLEPILRVLGKPDPESEIHVALRHWEEMSGESCPTDLANLMRAFADTQSVNTVLYAQGCPLVVWVAGFGHLLSVPFGRAPATHEMDWEGAFGRALTVDPGGDHANFLRDVVRDQIEIGGGPFYYYTLASGQINPRNAENLGALVYACALRELREHLSDADFAAGVTRVAPHLVRDREPAESLFASLPNVEHDEAWNPGESAESFRLTKTLNGTPDTTREWVTTAHRILQQRFARGDTSAVSEHELLLLRELVRVAEPAADEPKRASNAIYAGLFALMLEPESLDSWAKQAQSHPSHLVLDAVKTLTGEPHPVLVQLQELIAAARAFTGEPDMRVERCAPNPFERDFYLRHGRW